MVAPTFEAGYDDVNDVADSIVESLGEGNHGVVEVVPTEALERHLSEAVVNDGALDDDEWHDLVAALKDELLARDLMIA